MTFISASLVLLPSLLTSLWVKWKARGAGVEYFFSAYVRLDEVGVGYFPSPIPKTLVGPDVGCFPFSRAVSFWCNASWFDYGK